MRMVFIRQAFTSASIFAVAHSRPPFSWTPKPNRIAATISGRIALRLNSSVKSGLVKKLMIRVGTLISVASAVSTASKPCGTMGTRRTMIYMMTAAMPAVQRKVSTVVPMTLPAFLALVMLATALEIEKNTIGTTTQNIMLMKMVPSGSRQVAPGHTAPTIAPATMPRTIVSRNQLFLKKLFDFMSGILLFPCWMMSYYIRNKNTDNCDSCLKLCKKCGKIPPLTLKTALIWHLHRYWSCFAASEGNAPQQAPAAAIYNGSALPFFCAAG